MSLGHLLQVTELQNYSISRITVLVSFLFVSSNTNCFVSFRFVEYHKPNESNVVNRTLLKTTSPSPTLSLVWAPGFGRHSPSGSPAEAKEEKCLGNCWFSHDVTKIQTKKLSILLTFYFHDALGQLKTNFHTNFRFKGVLGFVIEYD